MREYMCIRDKVNRFFGKICFTIIHWWESGEEKERDSYKGRRDNKKRERQLEVEETMGRERETESGEKRHDQISKYLIKRRRELW